MEKIFAIISTCILITSCSYFRPENAIYDKGVVSDVSKTYNYFDSHYELEVVCLNHKYKSKYLNGNIGKVYKTNKKEDLNGFKVGDTVNVYKPYIGGKKYVYNPITNKKLVFENTDYIRKIK